MARFKYLGQKDRPNLVKTKGDSLKLRLHLKDGSIVELAPKSGGKFTPGQDIGYDITDERVIRHLSVDTRFQRIS